MLVTFCNIVLMPLFPPIYLYSCSPHLLYIGMLFPHCFLLFLFLFYLTLIWCFLLLFLILVKRLQLKFGLCQQQGWLRTMPVTSLGHQEGRRVFWEGPNFWTMSNIFKLCPTHFSRGSENFSRGGFAPCTPLITGLLRTWPRWSFANPLWFNMLEHD